MIAKIKNITGNGHYDGQHGRLFKQLYVFDNDVEVSANHKTAESPFSIGDEVEYEIAGTNSYGSWGKVRKPDAEGKYSKKSVTVGDDRSVVIERSWAMGQAISMMGSLPARNQDSVVEYMKDACVLAETILNARDTFPKFHQDDAVKARWASEMADEDELPF